MTPNFQYNTPVFVRSRHHSITWRGKTFSYNDYFPWQEMGVPVETVKILYDTDRLYHNEELEVQSRVGDRLAEFNNEKLATLVRLINQMVKARCTTDKEFQSKRVKISKLEDKQRGLIRSWINRNDWALDEYYEIRDKLLGDKPEPQED